MSRFPVSPPMGIMAIGIMVIIGIGIGFGRRFPLAMNVMAIDQGH